jgi:hypothetical protein
MAVVTLQTVLSLLKVTMPIPRSSGKHWLGFPFKIAGTISHA